MIIFSFTNEESFLCSQWFLYSSVHKLVIEGTDKNGENWYMTNNNQFTVSNKRPILLTRETSAIDVFPIIFDSRGLRPDMLRFPYVCVMTFTLGL